MVNIDLRNGDCMELLKTIPDNSIDCIVTSPPYNKKGLTGEKKINEHIIWKKCNIDYDVYSDDMEEEEYAKWQIEFLNECYRVLKPTGSMFYNHKVRRFNCQAYYPIWVFQTKFKFYQQIIWGRIGALDVNKAYLYPNTELIFWLTKDKPLVYKDNAKFQKEIWEIPPTTGEVHPATYPYELPENCVLLSTKENDTVLDPFMGIGTTGTVCKDLNRNFIGFELSENYFKLAKDRIDNHIKGEKDIKQIDKNDKVDLF